MLRRDPNHASPPTLLTEIASDRKTHDHRDTQRRIVDSSKAELNLGYIWLISIVAALGGLLFGWDWVVIGGAKPFFERYFQISTNAALIGWANSCALIGCLVGALVAGALSDDSAANGC